MALRIFRVCMSRCYATVCLLKAHVIAWKRRRAVLHVLFFLPRPSSFSSNGRLGVPTNPTQFGLRAEGSYTILAVLRHDQIINFLLGFEYFVPLTIWFGLFFLHSYVWKIRKNSQKVINRDRPLVSRKGVFFPRGRPVSAVHGSKTHSRNSSCSVEGTMELR